jgi:hypothetical protein
MIYSILSLIMNYILRSTIINLYDSLHKCGILHNDIAAKHWLVKDPLSPRNEMSFRLIDFEGAILREEVEGQERWEEMVEEEMRAVREVIDGVPFSHP